MNILHKKVDSTEIWKRASSDNLTTASFRDGQASNKKIKKRSSAAEFIEINTSHTAHPTGN
jgi:hypothetical protein